MILTGPEIHRLVQRGDLTVDPWPGSVESNAVAVHLGPTLLVHDGPLDVDEAPEPRLVTIPEEGVVLEPGLLYIGHTIERTGGPGHATQLWGTRSLASLGVWIHVSAELGHVGAVVQWTLEIVVCQRVRLRAGCRVGKVCFWTTQGETRTYAGRYRDQSGPTASRLSADRRPA